MSGPSKQPHNAGQTVIVQQISSMPVSDMDWGPITVSENWGRLFISWKDQEIIAVMGHYPKLLAAIQNFIEPAARTPDPAQIRADALREAMEAVRLNSWIHQGTDAYSQGMDAGARLQNKLDYDAILAVIATPLSPTAVDNSPAPDAGGKEGV